MVRPCGRGCRNLYFYFYRQVRSTCFTPSMFNLIARLPKPSRIVTTYTLQCLAKYFASQEWTHSGKFSTVGRSYRHQTLVIDSRRSKVLRRLRNWQLRFVFFLNGTFDKASLTVVVCFLRIWNTILAPNVVIIKILQLPWYHIASYWEAKSRGAVYGSSHRHA